MTEVERKQLLAALRKEGLTWKQIAGRLGRSGQHWRRVLVGRAPEQQRRSGPHENQETKAGTFDTYQYCLLRDQKMMQEQIRRR